MEQNPATSDNPFNSYYISPTFVIKAAQTAFDVLNEGKGGWFQLGLYGVVHKQFAEPPTGSSSSFSMPDRPEQSLEERRLMIPASQDAYSRWLEDVMFQFGRKLNSSP